MQHIFFQDNQLHSTYSDGAHSLEEIFEYNRTHDRLDLTVSDHVDMHTDWFARYVMHIKKLRKQYPEFSVKIGCEVKILDDGELNTTTAILKQAEVVLGSVHHFAGIKRMTPQELTKREYELTRLLAVHKRIDILAHPFSMGVRFHKSDVPRAWVKDIYERCKKNGIKFEYNHKQAPESVRIFVRELVRKGEIKHLSFGSDMHTNLAELGMSGFKVQQPVNVLVTGAGAGVGQSILKALRLSPVQMRIIAADGSALAAGLYSTDAAYLVPMYDDARYVSRISEICKKERVDLIFAGTDVELEVLSRNAKKIQSATGATVVVGSVRTIRIADDKWETVQFLKKNKFPYPASCLVKDLPDFLRKAAFPLIVKPRIGARSVGVYKVNNQKDLERALMGQPNAIIQEYLATPDDEYTCSGYFYKGKNYGVLCGQRWLRNGDTYKARFTRDEKLEAFIAKVGSRLDLFGPCNFQLRKTKRGPVIFEINSRFSGTTGAMSFLGFNVANALVQTIVLKRPPSKLFFNESYMLRYWNELFVSETEVKRLRKKGKLDSPKSQQNLL